jgi:hypothetical protein
MECWIQGALLDAKRLCRHLLDALGNAKAVQLLAC